MTLGNQMELPHFSSSPANRDAACLPIPVASKYVLIHPSWEWYHKLRFLFLAIYSALWTTRRIYGGNGEGMMTACGTTIVTTKL